MVLYTAIGAVIATAAAYAAAQAPSANLVVIDSVAFGGVLLLTGTTMLASKLICGPYVGTVVRMEALAAGDLESTISYATHRDCVGRMTKAMAIFRSKMEEAMVAANQKTMAEGLATGLQKLAQGDLSHRITVIFPPQYETLRSDFNSAMEALSTTLGAVSQASEGVHTGATEISQASDELSHRTEQQAANLEETAATIDELTATVRDAAGKAARASKAVIQVREEAETSGSVVSRAIEAMGGIERSSSEISEIISVIDGIAFQTNLLALNAGVEAARAGDAGRGFAVVASEVRALAQRSADAAKDVKSRITASSNQVDAGVTLVGQTGHALQRIIASIGEIDGLVGGLANSVAQQASSLQEVNTAVTEMDGVTQQNAAMVEQSTAASRVLAAEADTLARHVGHFTLGGTARPGRADPSANTVHQLRPRTMRTQRVARGHV